MNNNFNHLMLLYDRAYKLCLQIKELIENNKIEDLAEAINIKGEVFKNILSFEKTFSGTQDEEEKRLEFRGKIEALEKANIELLARKKEDLRLELNKVSKGKKLVQAYMADIPETYSSVDIRE